MVVASSGTPPADARPHASWRAARSESWQARDGRRTAKPSASRRAEVDRFAAPFKFESPCPTFAAPIKFESPCPTFAAPFKFESRLAAPLEGRRPEPLDATPSRSGRTGIHAMPRRPRQLVLARTSTWGGARRGAGRKLPMDRRPVVQHRRRSEHRAAFPVHVTLRTRASIPSLRLQRTFAIVQDAIARASTSRFRILHFSVQNDHMHLIVEAEDTNALSSGIGALKIRIARGINRAISRRGVIWADRYHARALRTPREVRFGLIYVLQNWKKHIRNANGLDGRSSAPWFDGWMEPPQRPAGRAPVVTPRTWLAAIGWRHRAGGPLRPDEEPRQ